LKIRGVFTSKAKGILPLDNRAGIDKMDLDGTVGPGEI
jgi:hypothetical protein